MANNHENYLNRRLRDDETAQAYLDACLREAIDAQDIGVFLLAVKDVIRARKVMSEIAENANLSRQNLYRALNENGNPTVETLFSVLSELGFKLAVERVAKKVG